VTREDQSTDHRAAVVESLRNPSLERAASFVANARDDDAYVTLVGTCTVASHGPRARTHPPGRRHATLKPDDSVLVHDATGHRPVHRRPDGDVLAVAIEGTDEETLEVTVGDRDTPPALRVSFTKVALASAFDATETDPVSESGTEAELKQRVLDDPEQLEAGLRPLATERQTPAGPVDVYAEDADGDPVVVELKRDRAGPDAVSQLERYVDALARDLHADADPRGILVAPGITAKARRLLAARGLSFVDARRFAH
jgi:hypothetical protein